MNSTFTTELIKTDSTDLVVRAMMDRRERILEAIAAKTVEPSEALTQELAELNIGIGDVGEETTHRLLVQNAHLRQLLQRVDAVTESLEQLGEKVDRLLGERS